MLSESEAKRTVQELSAFMDNCFEDIAKSKPILSKEKQLEQEKSSSSGSANASETYAASLFGLMSSNVTYFEGLS